MASSGSRAELSWDKVLAGVRSGQVSSAYVLYGDSFQTEVAARELIDALVEPSQRVWNLETYDGRTANLDTVLETLRTPGLGTGHKVVWLKESTLFLSGESRLQQVGSMFSDWQANRRRAAAEKLLSLVALAGWTEEQWGGTDWSRVSEKEQREVFGTELDAEQRATVQAIAAAAREMELRVVPHREQAEELVECVESGLAPGVILILTASTVDARRRPWQRLVRVATVVEFVLERQRSQALGSRSVAAIAQRVLRDHGKNIEPAALRILVERAGSDAQRLAAEVEKVCLWVGERGSITPADVEAVAADLAAAWVFDFTAAFAERKADRAASLLRQLLEEGEVPLRLLALLAREVRNLLLAREAIEQELGGKPVPSEFAAFQRQTLPRLEAATREAFGNLHPFVLFRCFCNAQNWRAEELRAAWIRLAQLDAELKSGRGNPALLLEHFVFEIVGGGATASLPASN